MISSACISCGNAIPEGASLCGALECGLRPLDVEPASEGANTTDDDEDWTLTDEKIAEVLAMVEANPCPRFAVVRNDEERTERALYIIGKKALSELRDHRHVSRVRESIALRDLRARTEPPWDDLDPGIRATVRALWDCGYEPTDSGDGSKAGTMGCAIETHHVFMRCEPDDLAKRAWDLWVLVSDWPSSGDYNGNRVEASYSPADGVGVLMLFGCVAP